MTSAAASRSPWAEFQRRLRRERALIAVIELTWQKRLALRAWGLYAFAVFVGYSIAIVTAQGESRGTLIHGFVRAALIALSLGVAAPAALSAARALAEQERGALLALVTQRGHSPRALASAQTVAAAIRIARLVAVPALLLVALGLGRGANALWAAAVAPGVVIYAAALGLGLAWLAQFAASLAPRHARAMLGALILGPWLAAQAYSVIPSVPALYSALLERLLATGAALS